MITAHINLTNLTYNFNQLKSLLKPQTKILGVVKANAYGHGLVPIARHLQKIGASYLGVARLNEALILRRNEINLPILILNPILPVEFKQAIQNNITLTITELEHIKILNKLKQKTTIHIKIDTGMHRSGINPQKISILTKLIQNSKNIKLEGIFTHFADADNLNPSSTLKQLKTFNQSLRKIKKEGIKSRFIHVANSAATIKFPETHFNLVRPGLAIYGHNPFYPNKCPLNLKPLLKLTAPISRIHTLKKNEVIGYSHTYKAKKDIKIATIAAGYADGIRRAPKPWPYITINKQIAPIIGRISMDQISIDINNIKPKPKINDQVILIDDEINSSNNAENIADQIGTCSYEVLSSLSQRIKRTYFF